MSTDARHPPSDRGIAARRMTEAVARGRFELPQCEDCGAIQYPPRERCLKCLSGSLRWTAAVPHGTLLARTSIRHSNEPWFQSRLPVEIGSVQLDGGPVLITMIDDAALVPGARVRIVARLDVVQQAILAAVPY